MTEYFLSRMRKDARLAPISSSPQMLKGMT